MPFPLSWSAGVFYPPAAALLLCLCAACSGGRLTEEPVDEQFGHRYPEAAPGGRTVLEITPPDSLREYFFYPAVIDSVHVRPAPLDPGLPAETQRVPVEVLIKGALPDLCTELHGVEQIRTGHILDVELLIRRPKGAVCARTMHTYRFYLMLEGLYEPGFYTLKLNDSIYAFEVRASPARVR